MSGWTWYNKLALLEIKLTKHFCLSVFKHPLSMCVFVPAAGRGLVWSEDTEMSYTNWEAHDVAFSVLSPKSCFWIQSNSGLWKPGSCRNRTHGVICKQPRSKHTTHEANLSKGDVILRTRSHWVSWILEQTSQQRSWAWQSSHPAGDEIKCK